MKWIEAVIETESTEIDDLCLLLQENGVEGITIEDAADFQSFLEQNRQYWDYVDEQLQKQYADVSRIKFYLEDSPKGRTRLAAIRQQLQREITETVIDDADTATSYQKYYEPIPIGKRLLVIPDWLDPETNGRVPLRLEPGLAFGTGSHPTTQLCLKALDGMELTGKQVLDLGCGSGILGIAALVLGAARVEAWDVDPLAPEAARENAARNGIGAESYRARTGDILKDRTLRRDMAGRFDLVIANIVTDVIVVLSEFAGALLRPNGLFLCSGIIDGREAETEAALLRGGFAILEHNRQEEWNAFLCKIAGQTGATEKTQIRIN